MELEPFWVLFATPRNNTAVVAIALEGKQVLPPTRYSLFLLNSHYRLQFTFTVVYIDA